MTSIRGRGRPRRKRLSVALLDSSPSPESEFSKQPDGPSRPKPPVAVVPAADVPKYSEDDLQRILKTVLEARVPAPAPAPAVSEVPRDKLKARSPDVYRGKSHMDCNNFSQQCEDYFTTAGATGPTRIPFATSFLRDRISFRWQQYKRKRDRDSSVSVTWDEFKAFLRRSLGDSQAFVDTYWRKIKRDSQHQLEEVLDWAAHLEHLQAVLQEFDPTATLKEKIMIRCFLEGLRSSIWAQLDVRSWELDSWEEAVEKTVNAEAKALLQSASSTRKMD